MKKNRFIVHLLEGVGLPAVLVLERPTPLALNLEHERNSKISPNMLTHSMIRSKNGNLGTKNRIFGKFLWFTRFLRARRMAIAA
jgi:hypothetical protein